jgi:geranylgeranyl diphosphate synthase type II
VNVDLEHEMAATRAAVEARLAALLAGGPASLLDGMRYAVLGGGKRLRPILCLWTHELCGGDDPEGALDAACALELLHTYSLVHDDLPCMDDDDLRRGRLTCHVVYGEGMAVLIGDALLNLAYETVLAAPWRHPERGLEVARTLAAAASHRGLVGGQVLDLEAEGKPPDAARLEAIHRAKTGALMQAAVLCGALAAGAGAADREALGRIGGELGLAFQIVDDVLDQTAGAAELGKSPGKDRNAGKLTYPAVHGLESSRRQARQRIEAVRAALGRWPGSERLRELALDIVSRAG